MRFQVDPTVDPLNRYKPKTHRSSRNVATSLLGACIELHTDFNRDVRPRALRDVMVMATSDLTVVTVYLVNEHVHFQAVDDDGNLFDLFAAWGERGYFKIREVS